MNREKLLNSLSLAPQRRCNSVHECCLCPETIKLGQIYHDRGYGRRAHRECLADALSKGGESETAGKYTARQESSGQWLVEGPGLSEPWTCSGIGHAGEINRLMNFAAQTALEWAAGQVEKEADEARGDRGEDTEASFKLRRLAAQIREGAP